MVGAQVLMKNSGSSVYKTAILISCFASEAAELKQKKVEQMKKMNLSRSTRGLFYPQDIVVCSGEYCYW